MPQVEGPPGRELLSVPPSPCQVFGRDHNGSFSSQSNATRAHKLQKEASSSIFPSLPRLKSKYYQVKSCLRPMQEKNMGKKQHLKLDSRPWSFRQRAKPWTSISVRIRTEGHFRNRLENVQCPGEANLRVQGHVLVAAT